MDCASLPCRSSPSGYHDFDADSDYCRVRVLAPVGAACTGTKLGNVTVFEGQSQSGATEVSVCHVDAGAYCDNGTCAARVAVGGACGGYASCAGTDTYCAGTCKTKVPAGSSCADSSEACQDDAYCPFPEDVCKPRATDGAACSSNEECLSSYCDGTCKAHPGFGGLALGMFCA